MPPTLSTLVPCLPAKPRYLILKVKTCMSNITWFITRIFSSLLRFLGPSLSYSIFCLIRPNCNMSHTLCLPIVSSGLRTGRDRPTRMKRMEGMSDSTKYGCQKAKERTTLSITLTISGRSLEPHLSNNSRPIIDQNVNIMAKSYPDPGHGIQLQCLPKCSAQGIVSNTTQVQLHWQRWCLRHTRRDVKRAEVLDTPNRLFLVKSSCLDRSNRDTSLR